MKLMCKECGTQFQISTVNFIHDSCGRRNRIFILESLEPIMLEIVSILAKKGVTVLEYEVPKFYSVEIFQKIRLYIKFARLLHDDNLLDPRFKYSWDVEEKADDTSSMTTTTLEHERFFDEEFNIENYYDIQHMLNRLREWAVNIRREVKAE